MRALSIYRIASLTVAIAMAWSCGKDTVPTAPPAASGPDATFGTVRALARPRAVFLTTPADQDGLIAGPSPLSVQFNLCQSRPESEDDDLKYTYDFDGDGAVDSFGHCRASHVYENGGSGRACAPARVCVSDRRPDGELCRSYEVCVEGGRPTAPAPAGPPTVHETEPNDDGSPEMDGDVPEGNDFDLAAAAAQTPITTTTFVTGTISPPGDEDYFKLSIAGPHDVFVEIDLVDASGAPACFSNAALAARFDDGDFAGGSKAPCAHLEGMLSPGTFYFGVMGDSDGEVFPYTVRVKMTP